MPKGEKKSLGEALVERGLVTPEKLKKAKEEADRTKEPLRRVLTRLGMVEEDAIISFFEQQLGIPRIDFSNYLLDPKVIDILPENFCRKNMILPLFKTGGTLTIAMVDPLDIFALDEARLKAKCEVEPVVVPEKELIKAFDQFYGARGTMDDIVKSVDKNKFQVKEGAESDLKALQGMVEEAPIVKLVNLLISEAIKAGASDI
ncbi:MAG: type II secretion system protein GspE, partial [Candidatus Omnitrophica bacterium]|nr:type II secretion system protein GspE [Candidatus Omnitrophota bacterium]